MIDKCTFLQVHDPVVFLKKGENAYVTIEPTAPIGCRYSELSGNCTHFFYMVIPEEEGCDLSSIIDVQRVKRCGGELKVNDTRYLCSLSNVIKKYTCSFYF